MLFSAAKHWKYWIAPLFAIALFTLYIWRQTPGHDWYLGDCAMYLMHARNLAGGLPYAQTAYIRQPETFLIGPSTYPAGYPLLLAPLYALYGYNFLAFKTLTNGLLALSTFLIFLYVRRTTGDAVAWLIMFAVGLSKFYFSVWNVLGSDAAFLAELFLVLLLQDVAEERGDLDRRPVLWGVILGAGAWYVYTTRSLGAALFIGMILREVWRGWPRKGRLRTWLYLAALVATFIPLALVSSHLWHSDSTYGGQFVFSPAIWLNHLITCLKLFSYLWINGIGNLLRIALWAVSLPLALWGLFRRLRRGPKLSETFFICYMVVLIPYWDPVDRYLGPLYPIYLIYAWEGMNALLRFTRSGMAANLRYAAAAVVVAIGLSNLRPSNLQAPDADVASPAASDVFAYIRTNTPADALIVAHEPRWVGLFTGRRSSMLPYDSRFSGVVDRAGARYVLLFKRDPDDAARLAPLLAQEPQRYVRIYENGEFEIYEVRPSAAHASYLPTAWNL
ncbi:MAG: hypothetical protein ABSG03_07845 [Bryobacteraceae bacterium]|jgi:hypothetical protein